MDRRTLILGGAAAGAGFGLAVLAENRGWWEIPLISTPDPDSAMVRVGRRAEAWLLAWYDEALASAEGGQVRDRLAEYRSQHADHLASLNGRESDVEDAAGDPDRPPLPTDPAAWPGFLAEQEALAMAQDDTAVRIATDGEVARLFSLIGASEQLHARGWRNG